MPERTAEEIEALILEANANGFRVGYWQPITEELTRLAALVRERDAWWGATGDELRH